MNLAWTAATDNVGVVGYHVYRNGTLLATLGAATTYQDKGLAPRTTYRYTSMPSTQRATPARRRQAHPRRPQPTRRRRRCPPGPRPRRAGPASTLTWPATTDNVKVTGYTVYRNGVKLGTTTSLTWSDSTGVQGTTYQYSVDAYDAANNRSAASPTVSVKVPDVTAPSRPGTPDADGRHQERHRALDGGDGQRRV